MKDRNEFKLTINQFSSFAWLLLLFLLLGFWANSVNELIYKLLWKIEVFIVDLMLFILFFLPLLLLLGFESLFLLSFCPFKLRLLKTFLKSFNKISDTFDFSVPEFIHSLVLIAYLPNQSKWQLKDMEGSFLASHCQNIRIVFMELHWWNPHWTYGVLHSPFMGLVHKIPNVDRAIGLANK